MIRRLDPALAAAVLAGAACLALSGALGVAAAGFVAAGLWGGARLRWVEDWSFAHIVVIAFCAVCGFFWGVISAFSLLLGWLTAHRAVVANGSTDDRLCLLLATLMTLVASVGTLSPAMAPAFLAFTLAAPVALLRSGGVVDTPISVGAAVGTASLTLAFFAVVPRLQGGMMAELGEPQAAARFSDEVALGDEWEEPDQDALVMRVRAWDRLGERIRGPIYLRGRVFDSFDGRSWASTGAAGRHSVGGWDTRAEIMLEPMEGTQIFGPPDVLHATSDQGPIVQRAEGDLAHDQPGRRIAYEVYSRSHSLTMVAAGERALLALPELDPRIAGVAAGLAPGSTDPEEIVAAAVRYLGSGFSYVLDPPQPPTDALAWFLFESRAGHCEYFATALAVLLRERGVPARLATGFYSAEEADGGGYTSVRRGHAHAWVEVPVRGGWATLDATPVGGFPNVEVSWWQAAGERLNDVWLSAVLDYDLDTQFGAAAGFGRLFVGPLPDDPIRERGRAGLAGAGVVLLTLLASGSVVRGFLGWISRPTASRRERSAMAGVFAGARSRVLAKGWDLPPALPPVEAGEWLVAAAGPAGEPLRDLAWAFYRERYAGVATPPAQVQAWVAALSKLPSPTA